MIPFASDAGEGKSLMPGVLLRASAEQTDGSFEVLEMRGPLSPPPHAHHGHNELFYVVSGDFEFLVGDDVIRARAGTMVLVPRGTPHTFEAGPEAHTLVLVAPAGLQGFFEELGAAQAAGKTQQEIRAALQGRYDSEPVQMSTKRN